MPYCGRKPGLFLLPLLAGAAAWSCSPAARDRALHFFFEIPPQPPANAAAAPSARAPEPPLAPRRGVVSIHPPFAQRKCLTCHVADNANQPPSPVAALCRQCHEPMFAPRRYAHGPFVAGACMQCHAPHVSSLPKLQRMEAPEQCLRCHEMKTFPRCTGRKLHPRSGCVACHDPHTADQRFLLKPRERWAALLPEAAASQPAGGRP